MPTQPNAIEVSGLSKAFRLPEHRVLTLKERALHPLRRSRINEFQVLKDVSFEVRPGEFFGILGRNGSGKSTLLKCLAGIYRADSGRILLSGQVAPFIELGVGFNAEMTARENVVINAVMMGLSPAEAKVRFPHIIEFAELEEFVDLKLKNYSSGMQVRLAFATMIQSQADVMLIDEVLAVGDASFQQKCFNVFDELREAGTTIVLVTHDVGVVERFCDRAMLIDEHRVAQIGDPEAVGQRYLAINFERTTKNDGSATPGALGETVFPDVRVLDAEGQTAAGARFGEPLGLRVLVHAPDHVVNPEIRVWLENRAGVEMFAASTLEFGRQLDDLTTGERRLMEIRLENRMASGPYHVSAMLVAHDPNRRVLAVNHRAFQFEVFGGDHVGGLVDIPHSMDLETVEEVT